jgi:hypothetical protein
MKEGSGSETVPLTNGSRRPKKNTDPVPGSCVFLSPGSGIGDPGWVKNEGPGYGIFPRA